MNLIKQKNIFFSSFKFCNSTSESKNFFQQQKKNKIQNKTKNIIKITKKKK